MLNTKIAASIWGRVSAPGFLGTLGSDPGEGIGKLLNVVLRGMIVIAGVYTLINFILAGYGFMSAGGDPGKMANARDKIWQSILGLIVAAGAFVIAALVGWILFNDVTFIINPTIPIP